MYKTYSEYLGSIYPFKVQKLTVTLPLSCPNRDGTLGRGGCIYCNNAAFSPSMELSSQTVRAQLEAGRNFFRKKYPEMKYLAYFQSYTNTHGLPVPQLMALYREALSPDDIRGLIIGTRPDCVTPGLLGELAALKEESGGKHVFMEFGAESSHDSTLERINRCHSWKQTVKAVGWSRGAGLETGLHFIMGLPGETREMMLETVDSINSLDIQSVKFHQLQIIEGTPLAKEYRANHSCVKPFTVEEYLDLCTEIAVRLRHDIAIERFTSSAPASLLIAPRWGLKNYEFTHLLQNRLKNREL